MKHFRIIIIFLLAMSCQETDKKHIAIGTWNNCSNDGNYTEYKITDEYILSMSTESDEILLFRNKIVDSNLVVSKLKNGISLLRNYDTLITVKKSDDKVVLQSSYSLMNTKLNKANFEIKPIDSSNLKSWKQKTLAEFRKRAKIKKCPDLRTEEEKIITTLNLDDELDALIELDSTIIER